MVAHSLPLTTEIYTRLLDVVNRIILALEKDLIYIAKIIKILYKEEIKEFNKIKRILIDFYPDLAVKIKKSDK